MFRITTILAWQGPLFQVMFVLLFLAEEGFTCRASPMGPSPWRKEVPTIIPSPDLFDPNQQKVKTFNYIITY